MILFLLKLKVSSFEIPTMMHSIPITAIFKITHNFLTFISISYMLPKMWGWGVTLLILH